MAIDLTGISNVNEFYSHHYLDSLLEGDLKGLFSKWKEDDNRTPDKKLAGISSEYFKAKSNALSESNTIDNLEYTQLFNYKLLEALGYTVEPDRKYTHEGITIPLLTAIKRDGSEYLWMIQSSFVAADINVLDQEFAYKTTDNEEDTWFEGSVEEAIQEILRLEEPPRWLILLGGQKVYLIDRTKWGQGKYLLFDLDEIFGRKQTDTLKATAALLSKDALAPEEGNILHDELDEKSHKHAFSVSEDLKYGIRRAVELIGNEFVYYRSQISKKKLYGDEELATKLTSESLNYLYRLLFLFYAESRSEELNVVPMKSEEYRLGYSLETLRELEQVPLTNDAARNGYFLHESLNMLFKIVNEGYGEDQYELNFEDRNSAYVDAGFDIDGLQSPLFDPKQTPLLSSVKFRNFVLQEVIQLLSLSKEGRKQRGRISYAQLGINQLGAVYEGLLSYSGFFAQENLFEVKPANVSSTNETGQSYFIPESEIDQYNGDEFACITDSEGTKIRKKYERGSFIFRLAGRDREKSASYYTPEVLTKSLVKYSLKEMLEGKSADDILKLKVCEPAMGSGAFLNEAVNQLADTYLERKQQELSETISTEEYAHERQKVKAYIATNNIYGVDLNPTATELAKVSLWLNTIYKGSKTPWFSARLAVGNSLVGARRQVFHAADLTSGNWHGKTPEKIEFDQGRDEDAIYHFLIPDKEMVAFDKDKVIKEIAKEDIERMKEWRTDFTKKFSSDEVETLKILSRRIDDLWRRHTDNRKRLFEVTKEPINIWGQLNHENEKRQLTIEDKEEELMKIKTASTSPYRALKMVMDYWCSLWFWPIEKSHLLPTRDEFLLDLSVILDAAQGFGTDIDVLIQSVERLGTIELLGKRSNFTHWEIEFPEVFEREKGFDLIIGNPPWIKLSWEEKSILSDYTPLINFRSMNATAIKILRGNLLTNNKVKSSYITEFEGITAQQAFLKSYLYRQLEGVKLNLYKSFFLLALDITDVDGIVSFIHQEGIYDDPKGGSLRAFLYPKLRYHFQFINELTLFDIDHHNSFGCSILSPRDKEFIEFINISNLFHPKTIDECFAYKGDGEVPGIKNKSFNWELQGHNRRVVIYNLELMSIINKLFEDGKTDVYKTKLLNIHSTEIINVLIKLSSYSYKISTLQEKVFDTVMLDETKAQTDEYILKETFIPSTTSELIYQGPHFFVATPFNKSPREVCKHNLDYDKINLNEIDKDYLPRTNYQLQDRGKSSIPIFNGKPITNYFRQIFRNMLSPTGERTLIGSLIPKGVTHINGCRSLVFTDNLTLVAFSGLASSIVLDFYVKTTGRSNLSKELFSSLPVPSSKNVLLPYLIARTLRLNCVTSHFKELWEELYPTLDLKDCFAKKDERLMPWVFSKEWNQSIPFKSDYERRQALIEIDIISALILGLTIEELIAFYGIHFPVLQEYENETYYDSNGNIVFTINRSISGSGVKRNIWTKIKDAQFDFDLDKSLSILYSPPFHKCDREADYRQAYEHFSKILKENS
ncbi:hypothetical protein CN439_25775 [Bacillus cereus]|uniref:Eco57I restriction-modification methylase domain-containing protein n=1 Tax=Bacillus cereus TaxID=1396 RepID=UPI000BF6966B|nr:N-6 DNA methylase [Bacillus cereus]PEW10404.1 hypothetical protein CN439_25775 [Bacillus cereus]